MTPIFFRKAEELRDLWDASLSNDVAKDFLASPSTSTPATETILDIAHWTSRATFDVIGLAGFDYEFSSLQDESEEVYLAYRRMFAVADTSPQLRGLLQIYFPFIESILVSIQFFGRYIITDITNSQMKLPEPRVIACELSMKQGNDWLQARNWPF